MIILHLIQIDSQTQVISANGWCVIKRQNYGQGTVVHDITPVTWEAETGRSWFKDRLGKMIVRYYLKNKLSMVAHICNPSYIRWR
jgi:hypothetical protein